MKKLVCIAFLWVALVLALLAPAGWAAEDGDRVAGTLEQAEPESLGLSSERLARIGEVMNDHVEAGRIPGAIAVVARRGKIAYFETFGYHDREAKTAMREDSIFRMYSMTKPATGVAVMMLHELHGFSLLTPVKRWLPELGEMKVAVDRVDSETGERVYRLEPTHRDITVRDLLTHSSGINYAGPRDRRGNRIYQQLGVSDRDQTIAEAVEKIGEAPLVHQPGTVWDYGLGMDVLGRLIEVISGQTFDVFLEQHIFAPLGMTDTAFHVPAAKKDRLVALYTPDQEADDGTVKRSSARPATSYLTKPKMFLGGAGLVSTARDYLRFSQMLLNGGELDGVRLLSPKTVELMTRDHIGDMSRAGALLPPGAGFGLTMAVTTDAGIAGSLGSDGEFRWGGAAGTRFWVDPEEEMVTLFMINILPYRGLSYGTQFKNLAYQSIVE